MSSRAHNGKNVFSYQTISFYCIVHRTQR